MKPHMYRYRGGWWVAYCGVDRYRLTDRPYFGAFAGRWIDAARQIRAAQGAGWK